MEQNTAAQRAAKDCVAMAIADAVPAHSGPIRHAGGRISESLAGGETRGLQHHGWSQMANALCNDVHQPVAKSDAVIPPPGDPSIAIRRLRKGMRDIRDRVVCAVRTMADDRGHRCRRRRAIIVNASR
jgi:hypothetical protein